VLAGSKATGVLGAITCLKKLCNHVKLIYDMLHTKAQAGDAVVFVCAQGTCCLVGAGEAATLWNPARRGAFESPSRAA
jgi:hypothetical protein